MNIGVAVLAACAHAAEHRLYVALRASDVLVQAPQRVTGVVMIKLGDRADGLPALGRVTVLAGDVQIAMWAISPRCALIRRAAKRA